MAASRPPLVMNDPMPTRKVSASIIASSSVLALIYILNTYVPLFQHTPIDSVLSGILVGLAGNAAAYFTNPGHGDVARIEQ